jgi:hypothetical protein
MALRGAISDLVGAAESSRSSRSSISVEIWYDIARFYPSVIGPANSLIPENRACSLRSYSLLFFRGGDRETAI